MQNRLRSTGRSTDSREPAIPIGDAARLGRELGRRGFSGIERHPENSLLHQEVMYHAQSEITVAVMRRGNAGLEGAAVKGLSRTDIAEAAPMVNPDPEDSEPEGLDGVTETTWAEGVTWMYGRGIWRPRRYPIGSARTVLDRTDQEVGTDE